MDWNRVGKHELVGLSTIAMKDLRWMFQAQAGQQRQLAVPVMKAGAVVEGHDHQGCQLNLVVKVMPSAVPAPQQASYPFLLSRRRVIEFNCSPLTQQVPDSNQAIANDADDVIKHSLRASGGAYELTEPIPESITAMHIQVTVMSAGGSHLFMSFSTVPSALFVNRANRCRTFAQDRHAWFHRLLREI